jgi:two-component system sensor histidine kinase KdpD
VRQLFSWCLQISAGFSGRIGVGRNLYGIFTGLVRYIEHMNKLHYWVGHACAIGAATICTLIGQLMTPRFDIVNIAMVYLLAVVVIALCFSRSAAILSAVLCVLVFDFTFVPPQGTLTVNDAQYLLTFAIMLIVALVISILMESRRRQERQRAELELVADTERLRSALLASISHDLRTPLAVMTGASSTLAESGEKMSSSERTALAQSVYGQARDMAEQVSKILQMTRLEAGGIEVDFDWASISEIIGSAIARLSDRLAHHRVTVDIPNDLPLLRIDAALIEQALVNLLENAARHTPPGTQVQIRAQLMDAELVVTVEDFGPGVDARDLDRLFAKFERGRSDTGGVGLGLAICRAIMQLHKGKVWADNLPDGGIAFRFSLPLTDAPKAPDAETH